MAISKKNKNRVTIDSKEHLWWVFDEHDQTAFDGLQMKAVCSDQTHFLKYGLQQVESDRKVVLSLRNYTKLVHLSCAPKFENEDGILTKSGMIHLIKWCKKDEHQFQYAVNGEHNHLTETEKQLLLSVLQAYL